MVRFPDAGSRAVGSAPVIAPDAAGVASQDSPNPQQYEEAQMRHFSQPALMGDRLGTYMQITEVHHVTIGPIKKGTLQFDPVVLRVWRPRSHCEGTMVIRRRNMGAPLS